MSEKTNNFLKTLANPAQQKNWVQNFLNFPVQNYEKMLEKNPEVFWNKVGRTRALNLFRFAATQVPAYKDFLKKHKINPAKIKTIEDFALVEPTDKINYIQKYPLRLRCVGGNLKISKITASSSGTSGNPNYWPRGDYQEFEAAITHELLFKNLYKIHEYSTLVIIGFPMGVYVSGMATALPSWLVSQKYKMNVVTVGNNKTEVLKAIKTLGGNFEQILIIGHPFFIKDVLETGTAQGILWNKLRIKMMFCSEGFTEQWREYVLKEAGIKNHNTAFNTYGSSELLLMAYETTMSVAIRKRLEQSTALTLSLTGNRQTPNLFQYNPALRFIQHEKNEFLFTATSGIPLIRFNLHDKGKIIPHAELTKLVTKDVAKNSWQLPFLSLEGRSDHTIVFYAANIYPGHIHHALSHKSLFKKITGKFTMTKGYHKNMDEFLEIHVELRLGVKTNKNLQRIIQKLAIASLRKLNIEYLFLLNNLQKDLAPKIKLWPYNHPTFFKPGLKPKYIQ